MIGNLSEKIFSIKDPPDFSETALEIFRFQSERNIVYRSFIGSLGINNKKVKDPAGIPFLPAEIFKTRKVLADNTEARLVFESSRTTGSSPGRHFIYDPGIYEQSYLRSFRYFYGEPSDYFISALLPSYIERKNSSLVYMMNGLIKLSKDKRSGFYRDDPSGLIENLNKARSSGMKTLLLGVSFALLDLANGYSPDLKGTIVMETGGMKGKRKEITREELHVILTAKFNLESIHSEYGMTELLSQAYSAGNGIFFCPPWMKILIRDPRDPLSLTDKPGITGGINVIDLANIYSCSFIATGDYGKLLANGGFEVTGRFDNSDIRGCNLMVD